jgi:hypothetical protein
MAAMPIRATFDFDSAEHYRASLAIHRATRSRWVWPALALLFGGYGAYQVIDYWGRYPARYIVIIAIPWFFFALMWSVTVPVSLRIAARRLPRNAPSVLAPQERELDEGGYHSRGGGVSVDVAWETMHRVLETKEFLVFFVTRKAADYIPKRVLDADTLAAARALLRNRLGTRANLQERALPTAQREG